MSIDDKTLHTEDLILEVKRGMQFNAIEDMRAYTIVCLKNCIMSLNRAVN